MRSTAWFLVMVIGLAVAAGCGNGAPTAEDSSFEKGLASAAAANKSAERSKNGFKRTIPSGVLKTPAQAAAEKSAGSQPAATGTAPASTGK